MSGNLNIPHTNCGDHESLRLSIFHLVKNATEFTELCDLLRACDCLFQSQHPRHELCDHETPETTPLAICRKWQQSQHNLHVFKGSCNHLASFNIHTRIVQSSDPETICFHPMKRQQTQYNLYGLSKGPAIIWPVLTSHTETVQSWETETTLPFGKKCSRIGPNCYVYQGAWIIWWISTSTHGLYCPLAPEKVACQFSENELNDW